MTNPNIPVDKKTKFVEIIGLFGGIILAFLVYYFMPLNAGEVALQTAGSAAAKLKVENLAIVAAVATLMGVWWMTEAIALPATALVPLVLFPIFGVASFKAVGASYASDIIFLFMGGFVLALAMQKWNLHTRIALGIVLMVGTSPKRLVGGFMIATGFITMWVSNTATAIMMLPVGLSVLHLVSKLTGKANEEAINDDIDHLREVATMGTQGGVLNTVVHKAKDICPEIKVKTNIYTSNFGIALMLGIAYSSSIGSLATIIGTPPNALLAGYMKDAFKIEIGFGEWMLVGVPISIVMLFACWYLLVNVLFKPEISEIPGGKEVIESEYKKLGKISRAEVLVGVIFILAAISWIFLGTAFKKMGIKVASLDAIIAMSVAVLLFIIPANKTGERLIDWNTAKRLPWDILLLFGGGLALSSQFSTSGLSYWIGHQVAVLGNLPILVMVLLVSLLVIFLTEITSNTATAAAFLPVLGGVAIGLGYGDLSVMLFVVPAALAATCAFMLPVATPPNAIAYGSGYVRVADMIKTGIWLNIIGAIIISLATITLVSWVFHIN